MREEGGDKEAGGNLKQSQLQRHALNRKRPVSDPLDVYVLIFRDLHQQRK